MEIPIEMDDLGVPLFSETPIYFHLHHINGLGFFVTGIPALLDSRFEADGVNLRNNYLGSCGMVKHTQQRWL